MRACYPTVQKTNDGQANNGKGQWWPAKCEQDTEKLDYERCKQHEADLQCVDSPLRQEHCCVEEVFQVVEILYQSFHQRTIVNSGPDGFGSSTEESASCMALSFDCLAWAMAR